MQILRNLEEEINIHQDEIVCLLYVLLSVSFDVSWASISLSYKSFASHISKLEVVKVQVYAKAAARRLWQTYFSKDILK